MAIPLRKNVETVSLVLISSEIIHGLNYFFQELPTVSYDSHYKGTRRLRRRPGPEGPALG